MRRQSILTSQLFCLFLYCLGTAAEPILPEGLADPRNSETVQSQAVQSEAVRSEAVRSEAERSPETIQQLYSIGGYWDSRVSTSLSSRAPASRYLNEYRIQTDLQYRGERVLFSAVVDMLHDQTRKDFDMQTRQLSMFYRVGEHLEIEFGRQALSWGTGEMIFVNDLFPKDWFSFFIGREKSYLKAPTDLMKVSVYGFGTGVDVVYTSRFVPDKYMDKAPGFRVDRFKDDEKALRVYCNVSSHELAFYAYSGYWRLPQVKALSPMQSYGASVRGPFVSGIVNLEAAYYRAAGYDRADSPSDRRLLLAGYEQQINRHLTASIRYHLESANGGTDHLMAARLNIQTMKQNMLISLAALSFVADGGSYYQLNSRYRLSDAWLMDFGGNVFPSDTRPFFGRYRQDSNLYVALRFVF